MGLKESLTELSSAEPSDLQMGVITCASKCNEVLQKLKIEKRDTERELESKNATIKELTSRLALLSKLHGMCVIDTIYRLVGYRIVPTSLFLG